MSFNEPPSGPGPRLSWSGPRPSVSESAPTSLRARFLAFIRRRRSRFSSNSRRSAQLAPEWAHHLPGPRRMSGQQQQQFDPATMAGLSEASQGSDDTNIDILEWYPQYQNCQKYFLDEAQHSDAVQALSAFLNIRLPFQRQPNPIFNSSASANPPPTHPQSPSAATPSSSLPPPVSLIPYIRRLVATGMDFPGVLHGFFGDDWATGVGPLHEQERRNYLFAAKSGGWASVKKDYDMPPLETVPFLRPLQGPVDAEIEAAERSWSEWLAMEDWMVGPRAPDVLQETLSQASRQHRGSRS